MDKCDECLCSGCYLSIVFNKNAEQNCEECISCNGENKCKMYCEKLFMRKRNSNQMDY
jgi:hypothetical protein